jgi:uncharacterized protein (TIGR03067 family)
MLLLGIALDRLVLPHDSTGDRIDERIRQPEAIADLEKFQGAWTWEGYTAIWKGENNEVYRGDMFYSKGVWKIDPFKHPKTYDYIAVEGAHKGDVLLGIYEFEGDTFQICFVEGSSKKPRPTEFSNGAKGGGTLQVWKRKK